MRAHRKATTVALLIACAGSALGQTSWSNPAGGLWNDTANWAPMNVPNTSTESAILGALAGPYIVECNVSTTILALTLDPAATLNISASQALLISTDGILNNGTIFINTTASGSNATLRAAASHSILGTGTIELNAQTVDLNDASIAGSGAAVMTIGAGQLVHGSGVVQGPINLLGIVESDRDGRDIDAAGDIDMTGGGEMRGSGTGRIRLTGRIVGGTLAGSVDGTGGSPSIDGSTSTGTNGVRAGSTLGLEAGGLTNDGTWIINTIASASNAMIRANTNTTIDGTGVLELNAETSDLNDAKLSGQPAAVLTLGAGQEVRGSGVVTGPVNLIGAVIADRDARDIVVTGAMDASGGGILRGENNGRVALEGQLTGGTLTGSVDAHQSVASVNGTTATGSNGVRHGSDLRLVGSGLTNNGTLTVNTIASASNARLICAESTLLDGSGNIDLNCTTSDLNDAQVFTLVNQTLTIGSLQSVTGSGAVNGTFALDGIINADRFERDIAVIGDLDLTGGGRLIGTNGGIVAIRGNITGGTIQGGVHAEGSVASFSGTLATGNNGLRPGADTSILSGGLTNNGLFTINTIASSANATLLIAENATINGNGTIDLNAVSFDLADARITVASGVTLTVGANQSITGSGLVSGTITCNGTFNADRAGRDLSVTANVNLSGGGVMQGTNGGSLALSGSAIGGQWLGGVETNNSTAAVSAVTMSGTNAVRDGSDMNLDAAGFTNNGLLVVNPVGSSANARITTPVSCTIDGSGTIELNALSFDYADSALRTTDAAVLTLGPDQTLAGRGLLTGDFLIQGTLAPGSAADETLDLSLIGTTTLGPNSTTRIGIGGFALTDFDRVAGSATLALDGTLELTLLGGYTPNFGDRFVIANVTAVTGQFDAVVTPAIGLGVFRIAVSATKVEAVWTCEADVNGDGVTDFFDVLAFLNAFTSESLYGDYNEDGVIDFFDVLAFLNDFASGC